MKKNFCSIFAAIALCCTFVACGDDDDNSISYSTTPEKATAGVYTGTWTRVGETSTDEFSGTVTLEAGETAGVTNITVSCPEAELSGTSPANIWNANRAFGFQQQVYALDSDNNPITVGVPNGIGAPFAGVISEEGVLTTNFNITKSERQGRKVVKVSYDYTFVGQK